MDTPYYSAIPTKLDRASMTENEWIKARTQELYDMLPLTTAEERKARTDIRDEVIELNYRYFAYVAKNKYIADPNITFEDKLQTALLVFCQLWWQYKFVPKFRADLSFTVFFQPRLSECMGRELNPIKYSLRRSVCIKAAAQVGKHWGKLTKDDIKKLGALMNKTDDPDDVVTYVKGLLSEDLDNTVHITYRKSGYGGFTAGGEEVNIRNYASKFDEVVGDISGIYIAILLRSNIGHSYYDKIIFSNNLDECKRAANDWLYSPDKGSVTYNDEHYYAMIVDLSKNEEIAHGDTWYTGGRISKGWREFPLKEDFDLDQFKDNLEREKDYYGEKAQGLKMLAFPLKRKIEKICNDFWADEYATAVDDLNDEISFAYEVEGDWKHDHLRFQNAVLNMLYEEGYEDVNHYEDVIDDDGSDTYKAIHTFEINASRQNQLSESLDEPFLHTTAPGEIDMAIEYFLEECKYSGYKAEITEVAEEDGYFIISGYIDEDVRSETSPSEILDILLDQLDMFDISVDVYTNWQINRLYRRMIFDITTKYHLENVNESLKEDWSWPEENGYINDAHERITFILDELAKIGFKHDEKYPIRDGLFGRKHIQIINPDLITSEETFEEDIKPLVDVLNSIEETFGETARMTYNIGANDDLQVTAGIDVGVK